MASEKTERACAMCVKRHEPSPGALECRARPPAQDVSRFAVFPQVRPDDYCHGEFQRDEVAAKALAASRADTARLDGLVTATIERETQRAIAARAQPELALEPASPAAPRPPRARRARAAAAAK